MTALGILALCVYVFGAYTYGSLLVLSLRRGGVVWSTAIAAGTDTIARRYNLALALLCTVWFVIHTVIASRWLMGDPGRNDWIDLAALVLTFAFPGLIFHTVLNENCSHAINGDRPHRLWSVALASLYAGGAAMALYFPAAIFEFVPAPGKLGATIGMAIAGLFSLCSVCSIAVMASQPRTTPTRDQRRLRTAMIGLFIGMLVVFVVLSFMDDRSRLIEVLDVGVRATPLAFLLVSIYFENRIEFYDLIIKRGVILLLSLFILAATLALALPQMDMLPGGVTRAWLFGVVLLPLAMTMPWLHHHVGRLLDRLWFGREFTPVEAVKHVLGSMQQATDEPTLVRATEATLSDMFRRRVRILVDDQPIPDRGGVAIEIRLPGSHQRIRLLVVNDGSARPLLSEDHALLRSLGGVFGFMLENIRLQRKRQEQEQVAQELRLQTSRSELKALRAQINPHFLFNALNAIASLIHTDPIRADAAVEQLAEVFRYTLRRSDQEWAPLDQELAFARAYLDVEQARFGRRLAFAIDAEPCATRAQVPSMLLHTLVENAVKHGISRLRLPGRIDVSARCRDNRLTLEVRDTGPGPDAADRPRPPGGESFGLRSVRDRLRGHFGAQASLELTREHEVTVARIELPLIEQPSSLAGASR